MAPPPRIVIDEVGGEHPQEMRKVANLAVICSRRAAAASARTCSKSDQPTSSLGKKLKTAWE